MSKKEQNMETWKKKAESPSYGPFLTSCPPSSIMQFSQKKIVIFVDDQGVAL